MKKLVFSLDQDKNIIQTLYDDDDTNIAQFIIESGNSGLSVKEISDIPKNLHDFMDLLDLMDTKIYITAETFLGNSLELAQFISNSIH